MDRRELLKGAAALGMLSSAGCATTPPRSGSATDEAAMDAAFFYTFPLFEFSRVAQQRTAMGGDTAALNHVAHAATLADHTSRQITAPNNDTIYSNAFLELSGGPIEIVSPSDLKRYFSLAFMDAFTDNFAYIGTRATKGQGGKFWLVGPQWRGAAPAGVTMLRSSTNDVWMIGRVLVDGPDDLAAARALQTQITMRPAADRLAKPFGVEATNAEDPTNFLGVVNDMLARSPGGKGQTARAARFSGHGIGRAASADMMAAWRDYLPKGVAKLKANTITSVEEVINGWRYSARVAGNFGVNDFLRARSALGGIGGMGEQEAMYLSARTDAGGSSLSGAAKYVWRVPSGGIPVDAFWSLTIYQLEADGRAFLVDNPIRRYSIGDRTRGIVKNPDGSIDILIQREAPTGPLAANWLPSPSGPMRLALRAYLPRKELLDRDWRVSPIERVG